jgi:hypothetical protein
MLALFLQKVQRSFEKVHETIVGISKEAERGIQGDNRSDIYQNEYGRRQPKVYSLSFHNSFQIVLY